MQIVSVQMRTHCWAVVLLSSPRKESCAFPWQVILELASLSKNKITGPFNRKSEFMIIVVLF